MDGDAARGVQHDAAHRPQVQYRAAHRGDRVFGRVRNDLRMIEAELAPILLVAVCREQLAGARMMEARVVQDHEAGVRRQVAPHEVVAPRIAELINDERIRSPSGAPGKLVCTIFVERLDDEVGFEVRQQLRRVGGNARPRGRQGRKPRDPWAGSEG
ncbi:MAG TPA: hypothetical protein VFR50_02745, partial [Casimicrobiaceae bacterium]|nr:hypothetical protein [Casimicrobiaceae bacterium]